MKITENRVITKTEVNRFLEELRGKEKSWHTIERYMHDVKAYMKFLNGREASAEETRGFKNMLVEKGYKPSSINTMLVSLSVFFKFMGWNECRIRGITIQKEAYCPEEKELTREEYELMVKGAGERDRLLIETICSTGIRVSELEAFTLEKVKTRSVMVKCKKKVRHVMVPDELAKELVGYAAKLGIASGPIFKGKEGEPLDRRRIWEIVKELAVSQGILESKAFPHNLRKLFARCFMENGGDISKLADVLGHSSIETTRIYIKTSGAEHRRLVNSLGLVLWTAPKTKDPPRAKRHRKGRKRKKK